MWGNQNSRGWQQVTDRKGTKGGMCGCYVSLVTLTFFFIRELIENRFGSKLNTPLVQLPFHFIGCQKAESRSLAFDWWCMLKSHIYSHTLLWLACCAFTPQMNCTRICLEVVSVRLLKEFARQLSHWPNQTELNGQSSTEPNKTGLVWR